MFQIVKELRSTYKNKLCIWKTAHLWSFPPIIVHNILPFLYGGNWDV